MLRSILLVVVLSSGAALAADSYIPDWPPCGPKSLKGPTDCPADHPCKRNPQICEMSATASLDKAVGEMDKQLRAHAEALPKEKKQRLLSLLDKQRKELEAVKAESAKPSAASAQQTTPKAMKDFLATGAELKKLLESEKGTVKSAEYSPDPSQCANHCERTCGYDSVGEKVCWYSCYYCCGKGGC